METLDPSGIPVRRSGAAVEFINLDVILARLDALEARQRVLEDHLEKCLHFHAHADVSSLMEAGHVTS
jgi:hypothetical protein